MIAYRAINENDEFNLKVFEDEFNNKFNNLQKSMKNSSFLFQ